MALIKSISGIRGTIGGTTGENLTPVDIVKFTAAYGSIIAEGKTAARIVVGRDGRISGGMVQGLVRGFEYGLGGGETGKTGDTDAEGAGKGGLASIKDDLGKAEAKLIQDHLGLDLVDPTQNYREFLPSIAPNQVAFP